MNAEHCIAAWRAFGWTLISPTGVGPIVFIVVVFAFVRWVTSDMCDI